MKKLLMAMVLAAGMAAAARAEVTPPVISTMTPQVIMSLADGLHLLDNTTPSTFRDNMQGEWLVGATTALYKKYYVSADMGWAQPIEQVSHGMYILGGRVYIGQLLVDKVPAFSALPNADIVVRSLVKYMTAGGWGARDFNNGKWRAGEYVGFEVKLDYLNWLSAH